MVLSALNRYYDILAADPDSRVAPFGYSEASVSFALSLSERGELLALVPLFELVPRGKKMEERPRRMIVPAANKRASGIAANFLCDNPTYVLGLVGDKKKDPDFALKRFQAFRDLHKTILGPLQSPAAQAVLAFLQQYNPITGPDHPLIADHLKELSKGGNCVFQVDGRFVHDDPEIRRAWEERFSDTVGIPTGQCLVTGQVGSIARLHPSLKGIRNANSTGASLVGFNARAYESYNKTDGQGLNAPVSEKATFAYTTALNYLLSGQGPCRKFFIGDTTIVYWAESSQPAYSQVIAGLFDPVSVMDVDEAADRPGRDPAAEKLLRDLAEKIRRGAGLDFQGLWDNLDPNVTFYVLGLAPNAARVAVRFFHADPFHALLRKMSAHYADLQIEKEYENQPAMIPLWQLVGETYSRKAANPEASPLMAGSLMRSILEGTPYPAAAFYAVINRVRADADDKSKNITRINYIRAAFIKAYLTRKYRSAPTNPFQEELCMSLNEQSTSQPYLLGRLFAVLERAQRDALGDNINATIKDRYFSSACVSPASVFPVLLRLSQHYIAKATYGYVSDQRIENILNKLDVENNPFPAHLSLDEQGIFVLGYYHQRNAFFHKKVAAEDTAAGEEPVQP